MNKTKMAKRKTFKGKTTKGVRSVSTAGFLKVPNKIKAGLAICAKGAKFDGNWKKYAIYQLSNIVGG